MAKKRKLESKSQDGTTLEAEAATAVLERPVRAKAHAVHLELELERIAQSPLNHRSDLGDLSELTLSIAQSGVLQPLLVRPASAGVEDANAGVTHELVFGHRRLAAAKRAGLLAVPVTVREMSDREVIEAQLVENLQRSDASPLDVADGIRALRDNHHVEVPEIAARLALSESAVYRRLRLATLSAPVREALASGKILVAAAEQISRIGNVERQEDALETMRTMVGRGAAPLSAAEARELVERTYLLEMSKAPFSPADDDLVPAAGPCSKCPKRTNNQPDLFGEGKKRGDLCTDPVCWKAKCDAAFELAAVDARAEGLVVVTGKKASWMFYEYDSRGTALRQAHEWLNLDDRASQEMRVPPSERNKKWRTVLGEVMPDLVAAKQVLFVRDPGGTPWQIANKAAALRALAKKGLLIKEKKPKRVGSAGASRAGGAADVDVEAIHKRDEALLAKALAECGRTLRVSEVESLTGARLLTLLIRQQLGEWVNDVGSQDYWERRHPGAKPVYNQARKDWFDSQVDAAEQSGLAALLLMAVELTLCVHDRAPSDSKVCESLIALCEIAAVDPESVPIESKPEPAPAVESPPPRAGGKSKKAKAKKGAR